MDVAKDMKVQDKRLCTGAKLRVLTRRMTGLE